MPANRKTKFIAWFCITLTLISSICYGKTNTPETFINPILTGYHPDPSVCRVGEDYYLVNSTFIWYPGIPVYHSKDLVNWKLIGHGIDRPSQLSYDGLKDRDGIYAVTIRHHEGVFYLITTLCGGDGGNFYLTATDPAGPWSDPVWLKDAPGIDPSLMWDDDGKCYYTGHTWIEVQHWPTQCGIWTQELDLDAQKLVGKREIFTYGHANNASYTEGAHLYKMDDNYMLLLSEGGTGPFHALSVHHSDNLWGPYVADMINPVITHRHLGKHAPVQAIGHGDLVQTQNGEWWCVTLGKRVLDGQTTLARETFLSKVHFEGKTPIFNEGAGKVLEEMQRPDLPWTPVEPTPIRDEFEGNALAGKWCTIRVPHEPYFTVANGKVQLDLTPETCAGTVHSPLLIQRIEHHKFAAATQMTFTSDQANEHAGLAIYRTSENYFLLFKEKNSIVLVRSFKGERKEIARAAYTNENVCFAVQGNDLKAAFSFGPNENEMQPIGDVQSLIVIADGNGNQFNGAGVGMFATSNGKASSNSAAFEWFEYEGK